MIDGLRDELRELLAPFVRAATNDRRWSLLLAELGADPEQANRAALASTLGAVIELSDEIERLGEHPAPSFEGVAAILDASRRAFAGLRSLDGNLADLGRDLVALLVAMHIRKRHPLAFQIAALLGLVEEGRAERVRMIVDRFRFERLGPLLRDPRAVLREEYGGWPATVADANALSDKLFHRVARALRLLGVATQYGFIESDRATLGEAAAFVDHALIVYASETLADAEVDAGAIFQWSSADRGDLGLVVTPFGALTVSRSIRAWTIALQVGAGIEAFSVGRQGHLLRAGTGVTGVDAKFSAVLPPATDGVAAVIGAKDGTRIEVMGAHVEALVAIANDTRELTVSAAVDKAALIIAPGDGDGFLRAVLPPNGVRADFDLGFVWSSERGLSLRGGVGLDMTQPLAIALGPLRLESLRLQIAAAPDGVRAAIGTAIGVRIGPVDALVEGLGLAATLEFPERDGNFGIANLDLDFKPPTGMQLGFEIGPVRAVGGLVFEPGRYAGRLSLAVADVFALELTGLIETRRPDGRDGFSMVLSGLASFPGIPVGFGFELCRVGAVFGMHRRLDVGALQAALADGRLAGLLTPPPPDAAPTALVAQLGAILPFAHGAFVGGVVLGFRWGHPTVADIDLGFLYDTSAPNQIVAIGSVAVKLPEDHPLVEIHVDVTGVVRFDPLFIELRARLRDSTLAGMQLTGDAALQLALGGSPRFLLALGGFHSGFTPPEGFPKLKRLALSLPANDYIELSLAGFFAITASSLQFGADLHFWAGIDGVLGIEGDASFEALVTWRPLHFAAALRVHVAVEVANTTLFGAGLRGTLEGPGPWHVTGGVYISVFGYDVEVYSVDKSFGSDEQPAALPPFDVLAAMKEALQAPRNWRARPLRDARGIGVAATGDDAICVHPLGEIEFTQTIAPLGVNIDRVGSARPSGPTRILLSAPTLGGVDASSEAVDSYFAPGQFFDLDDDERLSRPSFQKMQGGVRIVPAGGADPAAYAVRATMSYETIPSQPQRQPPGTVVIDGILVEHANAERWRGPKRSVQLRDRRYAIASTETMGVDDTLTPAGGYRSRAEARQALRAAVAGNAARAALLQIVERAA